MSVLTLTCVDNAKSISIPYETGQETLGWLRWQVKKRVATLAPNGRCLFYARLILDGQQLGSGDDKKPLDYFTISTSNWLVFPVFTPEGDNKIQLFVKTLDNRTITIVISPRETVESLKRVIQGREGILVQDQRIVFGEKQLEDGHMLVDYNLQRGSTLFQVSRLRGGLGLINGIEFVDMENKRGLNTVQLKNGDGEPIWWQVTNGLNLRGICTTRTCEAYNKYIVIKWGERNFDFAYNESECACPMCQNYVQPITCGFVRTWWKFWGVKVSKLNSPSKTVESAWTNTGDVYQVFDEKKSGVAKWSRLKILISKDDPSKKCYMCLETKGDVFKSGCGHEFHRDCIDRWRREEMSFSCPVCNKSL